MIVSDLIDELRRFPQGARIHFFDRQILVDVAPLEKDGITFFDVMCDDDELPDALIKALKRSN